MYEIIITKDVTVTYIQRGEYTKVGQVKADHDSDGMSYVNGVKDKYEYGPDRELQKKEKVEVYKQRVETLDLVPVINAVNVGGKQNV